jgi:hypothetical protein
MIPSDPLFTYFRDMKYALASKKHTKTKLTVVVFFSTVVVHECSIAMALQLKIQAYFCQEILGLSKELVR